MSHPQHTIAKRDRSYAQLCRKVASLLDPRTLIARVVREELLTTFLGESSETTVEAVERVFVILRRLGRRFTRGVLRERAILAYSALIRLQDYEPGDPEKVAREIRDLFAFTKSSGDAIDHVVREILTSLAALPREELNEARPRPVVTLTGFCSIRRQAGEQLFEELGRQVAARRGASVVVHAGGMQRAIVAESTLYPW